MKNTEKCKNIKKKDGKPLVEFSLKGKPLKYVLLLALFQPIIYFLGESYGIEYTSSAFAGTIIAVIPIMGIVFDVLIMKAGVTVKQVICAVVSVIGVAVTTLGAEGMKSSLIGVLFLLVAEVVNADFVILICSQVRYMYQSILSIDVWQTINSAVFIRVARSR